MKSAYCDLEKRKVFPRYPCHKLFSEQFFSSKWNLIFLYNLLKKDLLSNKKRVKRKVQIRS